MDQKDYLKIEKAVNLAISRIIKKGSDDVFRPPTFSSSLEVDLIATQPDKFADEVRPLAIDFLKQADLRKSKIGQIYKGLVTKDHNSFRQCAWIDPFDAVKYLSTAYLLFEKIESVRILKEMGVIHSHRKSDDPNEIFDVNFGYDSFRAKSSELSRERVGQWKVVTDISNFFDRIGNHSLENHLRSIGCEDKYISLIREILYFWAGDRRSFGVPVGSDASRILSEAVLINVDRNLSATGITFIRYVDDFRIFSKTRGEALKAIEILTTLLADEGLSLNSRKTDIHQIVDPEEISAIANRLAGGEHQQINLDEKTEVKKSTIISGRSSVSKYYREPGKEALKKIMEIPKQRLLEEFLQASEDQIETKTKLLVKYFVYVDQDQEILRVLLERRITSIYYISDALTKEMEKFDALKSLQIKDVIFGAVDWLNCAYPLQVPVLRIAGLEKFRNAEFVYALFDGHKHSDNLLFYREAISFGGPCLDRMRLRRLAIEIFPNVPKFVRRAIYVCIQEHQGLSKDEKRPLLKTMEQLDEDWFILNA